MYTVSHSLHYFWKRVLEVWGKLIKWIMLLNLMVNPFDLMFSFCRICIPWNISLKATEAWNTMKNILFKHYFDYVSYIPFSSLLRTFVYKSFLFHYYFEHRYMYNKNLGSYFGTWEYPWTVYLADIIYYQLVLACQIGWS